MLLEKVRQTIQKYKMLQKGDRVLVCVSGGPDSVALFILLAALKKEYGLTLEIAHLNHMLRAGDSDKDQKFVENLSRKYKMPVNIEKVDVKKLAAAQKKSIEEAARNARYEFFLKLGKEKNFNKIAVAHNKDDQAETVLMRLLRGAGVLGLGGIQPSRKIGPKQIIRPLIDINRSEIEKFLKNKKIIPRQDASNKKPIFLRNKIRLRLLPLLEKEYNPNIKEVLSSASDVLRQDYDFILSQARKNFKKIATVKRGESVALPLKALCALHKALERLVLRLSIEELKGDTRRINFRHLKQLDELIQRNKAGAIVDLPGGVSAKLVNKYVILYRKTSGKAKKKPANEIVALKIPGMAKIGQFKIKTSIVKNKNLNFLKKPDNIEYFDADKIKRPLYARRWKAGDRIRPFGMKGYKKIQDVFVDGKVPQAVRSQIPLIFSKNSGIIWVCGIKRSASAPVSGSAKSALKIECKKKL